MFEFYQKTQNKQKQFKKQALLDLAYKTAMQSEMICKHPAIIMSGKTVLAAACNEKHDGVYSFSVHAEENALRILSQATTTQKT